jgi:hypothetical protein
MGITMKSLKAFAVTLILLPVLFICSCDGSYTSDAKTFDKKLRGIWVSNETGLYSGSLKIDINTITIDGYGEDWTSLVGDDSRRPFRDFPKRLPLPGYSEEGEIFITYKNAPQDGIRFTYSEVGKYPQKYKLLEFDFGGRRETLQCMADY